VAQIEIRVLVMCMVSIPLTGIVPYQVLTGMINTPLHLPGKRIKIKTEKKWKLKRKSNGN